MSFEVKITAASLGELADKVLALGAQLSASTTLARPSAVMPEVAEQQQRIDAVASAKRVTAQAKAEVVAEQPAAAAPEPEAPAAEPQPVAEQPVAASVQAGEPATSAGYDFDKDIAPRVLAVVGKKGKATMQEILGEFGVERASQIPADVMAEFVEVLDKELAE